MVHRLKLPSKLMVIAFSLAIFLAGCLGGSPSGKAPGGGESPILPKGNIVGRVINEAGDGVFGALVTLDQPVVAAKTDAQGRYTLTGVPVDTYQIVVSMPGHAARKAPATTDNVSGLLTTLDHDDWAMHALNAITQSTSEVRVTVVADQTVEADDILLYPEPNTIDNIGITAVSPDVTTTLTAGSQVDLELGVFYSLQSQPEAALIIAAGYGDVLVAADIAYVTAGSGAASFSLSLEVPHAAFLTLEAYLINANLLTLAHNIQLGHPISGAQIPEAPTLEVGAPDMAGITLHWSGGTAANFGQYRIYRDRTIPTYKSGTLVGTIVDPTITTFFDSDMTLGGTYGYRLYLETLDGQLIPSNAVTVKNAGLVLTEIYFPDPAAINNLITDPVRERVYVIAETSQEITQISTQAEVIERVISLNCPPVGSTITPDGTYLFLTCPRQNTLVRVSLAGASPQVSYFTDVGTPYSVGVDSLSRNLYVSDRENPVITMFDIADMTKQRTETIDFVAQFIALSPDDALLIATELPRTSSSLSSVQTYSTADFAAGIGWEGPDYFDSTDRSLTVHPTRNKIYFGHKVLNLDSGLKEETLTDPILVVGRSDTYLYGARRFPARVSIYSRNDLTWTEHLLIQTAQINGMALAPDETKLYIATNDLGVKIIDLHHLNLY